MSNITLSWYVRLFESLSLDSKIELLSILAEKLNSAYNGKQEHEIEIDKSLLLKELCGAWAGADIDGDEIVNSRTISSREINL